ncbi:MAG: helix-turn-helix domain-containing protein [Clostridiales bacterium]|nr:helix-turn-helix domain-containing protein [Clostridiales bacterium]
MQLIVAKKLWVILMSIGERIVQLRNDKGVSQGQLAQILGVSRQAISKWENDQSSPDTLHLIKLADVLDTEVEYLATGRKPVYEEAPIVVNMVHKVDKVVEKVVEKPILRKIVRVKYVRNPLEYFLLAVISLIIGLILGAIFL